MTKTIEAKTSIRFDTKQTVSARELARSLHGLSELSDQLPEMFARIYDGLEITVDELLITEIRDGSIIEDIVKVLVFKSEADYQKWLSELPATMKDDPVRASAIIVGLLIFALISGGAGSWVASQFDDEKAAAIQADYSVVLNAAGDINISPDALQRAVDGAAKTKHGKVKSLTKRSIVDALAPCANDPNATLCIEGLDDIVLSAEAIASIPKQVSPPDPQEDERYDHLSAVELDIRVLDRDNPAAWKVLIPSINHSKRRLSLELGDDLDMEDVIAAGVTFTADITVVKKRSETGKYIPSRVILRALAE